MKQSHISVALLTQNQRNAHNNIDLIIEQSIDTKDPQHSLSLLEKATKMCDKFHSYFHYEESFFYTTRADIAAKEEGLPVAIDYYKNSIFMDHANLYAHGKLIKCYEEIDSIEEKYASQKYLKDLLLNDKGAIKPKRPFETFEQYLKFATFGNPNHQEISGFWKKFKEFEETKDVKILDGAIKDIGYRHKVYHLNAGIIYFNYYVALRELGSLQLSKNALLKAQNLNPNVAKL